MRHFAVGGRVDVARTAAGYGIEGDDAVAVDQGFCPLGPDEPGDHLALLLPPFFFLRILRVRSGLRGSEDVQRLETRGVVGPRRTAGVLQSPAELALIEVLYVAKRQDADVVLWIVDQLVAEFGGHGEAVEDEGLDIGKEVAALEAGKDASQRAGVESMGEVRFSWSVWYSWGD